jgi:DNA-binding NtrC family response regulator
VGDEKTRPVDVRIVAASNRDLEGLVGRGEFREDLYYRLNVVPIRVPPLRERVQDIPELCEHILARHAVSGAPRTIARAALARLSAYGWPGNVRELENELARAAALADGVIEVAHLSAQVAAASPAPAARAPRGRELQLRPQVEALERALVEEALRRTGGNQTAAARLLGLSRFGLQKKLRRYGIAAE